MRKWLTPLAVAALFFLLGFVYRYHLPQVKIWTIATIEELSGKYLPAKILIGDFSISAPWNIEISNVRIRFEHFPGPTPTQVIPIKKIHLELDLFRLLSGRLQIRNLQVSGLRFAITVPIDDQGPFEDPFAKISPALLNSILNIPITNLLISKSYLDFSLIGGKPPMPQRIVGQQFSLRAENFGKNLRITLSSPKVILSNTSGKPFLALGLATQIQLGSSFVKVNYFKALKGHSYVNLQGATNAPIYQVLSSKWVGEIFSQIDLKSLMEWLPGLQPTIKWPSASGRVGLKVRFSFQGKEILDHKIRLRGEQLVIRDMVIGQVVMEAHWKSPNLSLTTFLVENPSGVFRAKDTEFLLGDRIRFSSTVESTNFELQKLLRALNVGEIPVQLAISGRIGCAGEIHPDLLIECRGFTDVANLDVRLKNPSGPFVILEMPKGFVQGTATVTAKDVRFRADLKLNKTVGHSEGVVDFSTGFNVSYETNKFFLSDLKSLSELKFEGSIGIKGAISGNSETSTFSMQLSGEDFWLEDFGLGRWQSRLEYQKSKLYFKNFRGNFNSSRYEGNFTVDLASETIDLAGSFPYVEVKDLLEIFSRKTQLPVEITGSGSGSITVSGPFAFTKLTYKLDSNVYRGMVGSERFERATFKVHANRGQVVADKVEIVKSKSFIELTGTGSPNGTIDTRIRGSALKLEESQFIESLGLGLAGNVDFEMKLEGPVFRPFTELKGKITQCTLQSQRLKDSDFAFRFSAKAFEGSGQLLESTVVTHFVIPLAKGTPLLFKLDAREWNFVPFISWASGDRRREFESRLTAKLAIESPSGDLWDASGEFFVPLFQLRKGPLTLANQGPLAGQLKRGVLNVESFKLKGGDSDLEVRAQNSSQAHLNASVSGKLNLEFAHLIMPFFETMKGVAGFSFRVGGVRDKMEVLGSTYLDNGYLQLTQFPHPFEQVHADFLISQSKVLINSLTARVSGGTASAEGQVLLSGFKNLPVKVRVDFHDVTFRLPEKVESKGSGRIYVTGSWFPFLMSGNYDVSEGLLTREFQDSSNAVRVGRRASFLPPILLQSQFEPITLDMSVHLGEKFRILNALADGTLLGILKMSGFVDRPKLLGSLRLKKDSKIFFKETPFEVNTGTIELLDRKELEANLYLGASARVSDYEIALLIQGSSNNPKIDLSSLPPLSKGDIISLLALGMTSQQLEKTTTQEYQSTVQIGTQLFSKSGLAEGFKNPFGLKFQISTEYDSLNTGAPKISVSKQLSPKTTIVGSQTMGKNTKTEGTLEYKVNENWSSMLWLEQIEYGQSSGVLQRQEETPEKAGIDLRYKVEFK